MKVWVIMGGDYPDSVWADEDKADTEIERLKAEDKKQRPGQRPIYFRVYEYEVRK